MKEQQIREAKEKGGMTLFLAQVSAWLSLVFWIFLGLILLGIVVAVVAQ
jgi:hypothetical protein